jgi:hypothetical protein
MGGGQMLYCWACGVETTQGLNYCKACGSSLTPPVSGEPKVISFRVIFLFLLVAALGLVGPLGVFTSIPELTRGGAQMRDPSGLIAGLIVFGSLLGFGTVVLLGWLLMRLATIGGLVSTKKPAIGPIRKSSQMPDRTLISPPVGVISSVTENTTRNFEKNLR